MATEMIDEAEALGASGLDWLLSSAQACGAGLVWTGTPVDDEVDPTLYSGAAGIVLALLEGHRQFGDDRYGDAAVRGARALVAAVEELEDSSLYFGLTGVAVALRAVADLLGDASAGSAADRALEGVRSRFDGERWSTMFELFAGNAGIALGALSAGDVNLAELAVTPYLHRADPTPGGVNWAVRPGPARSHHIAHGTLGIVYALAAVARVTGRSDLLELALAGASDVVSRNEAGPTGFLVAHSDPPHKPELIERYSYGWCNGPTGDAQVFRLLGSVTDDPGWLGLQEQCWHTVTRSGLPERLWPGFMTIIRAAEAPRFELPGVEFIGLASPSRGSADVCTWRLTVQPTRDQPEPHTVDKDEVFMVISGTVRVTPQGEEIGAGDAVVVPAGDPIAMVVTSAEPAELYVAIPAGVTGTMADGTRISPPWAQ